MARTRQEGFRLLLLLRWMVQGFQVLQMKVCCFLIL